MRSHVQQLKLFERGVLIALVVFPAMQNFMSLDLWMLGGELGVYDAPATSKYSNVARLAFVVVALWVGIQAAVRPHVVKAACARTKLIAGFVIWIAVTSAWAPAPGGALNTAGRTLLLYLLAAILVERCSLKVLVAILAEAALVAIGLTVLLAVVWPRNAHDFGPYANAWRGAVTQKNYLGSMMAVCLAAGVFSLVLRTHATVVALSVIAGASFCLIMSRSATTAVGVAGTAAIVCLLSVTNATSAARDKLLGFCLAGLAVLAVALLFLVADNPFDALGRSANLTGRGLIWPVVWHYIQANPMLGYGNTFWGSVSALRSEIWVRVGWSVAHSHNTYLDLWFQLGIVGLILGSLVLLRNVGFVIRAFFVAGTVDILVWSALFLPILFRTMTETAFVAPAYDAIFWVTLAYAGFQKHRAGELQDVVRRASGQKPGRVTG